MIKPKNVSKIGCNLCRIASNNFHVILEYDYNLHGFREQSNYLMTKYYSYNGRTYDRTKPANFSRYYRLLSSIDIETYKRAYALFE